MIKKSVYNKLVKLNLKHKSSAIALIDPDIKNDSKLGKIVNIANNAGFDAIFVGGSIIMDSLFDSRLKFIKSNTDLPVILFPGSSNQVSKEADALLYLSLISGRNPQYLIGEHVKSAPKIYTIGLETIPTGYILIDGGCKTSVEIISNTISLPPNKMDIILSHALAGQFLGQKLIYLEMGSNSNKTIDPELVKYIKSKLSIPLIVGGGIKTVKSAKEISNSGADFIVLSSLLEQSLDMSYLKEVCDSIHEY